MPSKSKSKSAKPASKAREVMSENEAARACASMFVRKGIPEEKDLGEFEINDVSIDDDGNYHVTMIVRVGNLDIEMATSGQHLDQAELNAIRAEPRDE